MLRFGGGPHPKEWENAGDIRMTKTRHQMFLGGGMLAGWLFPIWTFAQSFHPLECKITTTSMFSVLLFTVFTVQHGIRQHVR